MKPTKRDTLIVSLAAGVLLLVFGILLFFWHPRQVKREADPTHYYEMLDKLEQLSSYCYDYKQLRGVWPANFYSLCYVTQITNTSLFTDSWGHPIVLLTMTNSSSAWLKSYGADGKPGGNGSNGDMNWELK